MLSALGDAVHVLPVVNALKRKWPGARITWIIQPVPYQLVQGHAAVDEFILFQRRRGVRGIRAFGDIRRALKGRHFDLLLNLQVYMKAGLITAFANADVKLGFDRRRARDLNWLFTTHRIAPHPPQHVQEQYFEFLDHLGVEARPAEWRIEFTEEEAAAQAVFLAQFDRPLCSVVVGTSKPAKNWSAEGYAQTLESLESDFGYQCLIVGGPSAAEREMADAIVARTRAKPVIALADGVRRLAWTLAASRLVISPDTGPLHLARALDVPVVGLYGYTNPRRYGPYARYGDLLVDGYALYPGEPYAPSMEYRSDGMSRVHVADVLDRVRLARERYGA
jgi:heptosyltransferase I